MNVLLAAAVQAAAARTKAHHAATATVDPHAAAELLATAAALTRTHDALVRAADNLGASENG